jgi:uncharacterized protein YecE (DUF72 family)
MKKDQTSIPAQFLIGTSGWTYDHWKGGFYPQGLAKSRWFDYYAERFPTVEVNATFYRRFGDQTYIKWRERSPADFCYVLKVPQLITHRKFLVDAGEEIHAFSRSASLLEDKLGLLLLQVAPQTRYNPELLRQAILEFDRPDLVAVEFRSQDWLNTEVRALLTECGATFVSVDSPKQKPLDWVTSKTGYIRLHGRSRWYSHDYTPAELEEIAGIARSMVKSGAKTVYIFFNNDFECYAPKNALALMDILKG